MTYKHKSCQPKAVENGAPPLSPRCTWQIKWKFISANFPSTNMEAQTSSSIPPPQKALPSPSQTNLKLSSKGNPAKRLLKIRKLVA